MEVSSTSKGNGIEKIKKDMARLMALDVLVGIPENKSARKDTDKVNNAQLLYLHTNGSALRHIPARPVIEPAIVANKEAIAEELKTSSKLILQGKTEQSMQQLKKVGMLGATVSKDWFTDSRNKWPPNAPRTIIRKLNKIKGKKGKEAITEYLKTGVTDKVTPLIDTGALRQSITFVVRKGGG